MRSKLELNLDQLAVDSFTTTKPQAKLGTVFGEQCTCYTNCTCPGCPTCDATCNGTCNATCANTCANTCDDGTCVRCNQTVYEQTCQDTCTQTAAYTYCNGVECW